MITMLTRNIKGKYNISYDMIEVPPNAENSSTGSVIVIQPGVGSGAVWEVKDLVFDGTQFDKALEKIDR